jgi:hypothetical protein
LRGTCLLVLALCGLQLAAGARADEWPKKIVLHPVTVPQPLLKYQLLPTMHERRPGNAAVFYGRIRDEQTLFFSSKEIWEEIYEADDASLSRVGAMKHARLHHKDPKFISLERAGQCEDCDWQYPVAEDGYVTLLPDAQGRREFARLLRADIRWRVAHGDFDGALRSLKAGYALARHTADSPLLVPALIGVAMSEVMSKCTLELIQQPDAPSLYWALTYLPEPFFDSRQIFEGEMQMHEAAFPQLVGSDPTSDEPAYWRRQLEEMAMVYEKQLCDSDAERTEFKRTMPLRLLRAYPLAKRALIETGRDAQEVEGMPAGKAIMLHAAQVYADLRDQALACLTLPYWQAIPHIEQFDRRLQQNKAEWVSPAPALGGISSIGVGLSALMRHDRQIALLRTLEALRLYAGEIGGTLPDRLDMIEVPLPVDPMTGKPFDYQLHGNVALISGPPLPGLPFQYEVQLATAGKQ